ncbi:C-X-C chemokine receptor type 4-like [Oryzias latipes]|nr:C-X-C chemokine receptor type 4-like [Oryzias latipes]
MELNKPIASVISALMFLASILGNNWLAVASLPKDRSAIRTNEVLFINLAVSNLITNYVVNLPETMADIADNWFLGETFCCVFLFSIDFSETSSLFSTFLISAFWHQKLVGSLKRGGAPVQLDNLCLVGFLLAGSWTVCAVFSIHHFFLASVEGINGSHRYCVDAFPSALAEQTFDIIFLTVANVFPLVGIIVASFQIVVTLLQSQKRIGGHTSVSPKEMIREDKSSQSKKQVMGPLKGLKVVRTYKSEPVTSSVTLPQTSSQNKTTGSNCSLGAPANHSKPSKANPNSSTQVRAAKSVVAVGSVVLVCWLTHLLLHITNTVHSSQSTLEVAGYITASYSCIIPYILLHGVKKLTCSHKR